MVTPSCRSLSESILRIDSLLHAGLPKTFPYTCPVSWCHQRYTKVTWYHKNIAKEHADLFEVEPNVGVVLNYVTDATVMVPLGHGHDDFED